MQKIETGKIHILLTDLRELPCSVPGKPASFAARKLTAAALSRFLGREPSPEELLGESRSENGKPFFPAYPDFHYNISHSGDYAALAFAGQPVGIDIQKIQDNTARALKIARHFFSPQENDALRRICSEAADGKDEISSVQGGPEFCRLFTRFWTARESYIKLTGRGLSEPFSDYRPDLDAGLIYPAGESGLVYYLGECEAPDGYCMTVCSADPIDNIDIKMNKLPGLS